MIQLLTRIKIEISQTAKYVITKFLAIHLLKPNKTITKTVWKSLMFQKFKVVLLAYPAGLRGVMNNDQSITLLTYIKKVFARTVA